MSMSITLRIACVLTAITAGYCVWDDVMRSPEDAAGVFASPLRKSPSAENKVAGPAPEVRVAGADVDLFADQGLAPPPPMPELPFVAPPPMPPQPPVLPFSVSGVWVEDAQRKIILHDGSISFILCHRCDDAGVLREGDLLDGRYRIDQIGGDTITLTYLPLQMKQTLRLDKAMAGTGA